MQSAFDTNPLTTMVLISGIIARIEELLRTDPDGQQVLIAEWISGAEVEGSPLSFAFSEDVIYRGPNTQIAFASLTKAVAALAFWPNGIELFGQSFEAVHGQPLNADLAEVKEANRLAISTALADGRAQPIAPSTRTKKKGASRAKR